METGKGIYTDGQTAPSAPNGQELVFNDGGTMRAVSSARPMPAFLPAVTTTELTTVNASASPVTILLANTARKAVSIFNTSTANLYIDESGGTPSSTRFTVKIPPSTLWEMSLPVSAVLISGVWDSANGTALVKECY